MSRLTWETESIQIALSHDKRYWLFANAEYEAAGGIKDFQGSFDTMEETVSKVRDLVGERSYPFEEGYIYDSIEKRIVASFEYDR